MCGINGIFNYRYDAGPIDFTELVRTRDHMAARGPDGQGAWISTEARVGFGHRRLSIIDLSEAGAQPMSNAENTLVITFNGEIYNYRELRGSLEAKGYVFRSHSDTEVLLHLYAHKGAEMVLDLRGMFAFAIWDHLKAELFLARDPFGIKPLYYADDGSTFRFASQVKALLAGGGVSSDRDPAGIVGFYLWGSVPDPFTTYRAISALPAGHTLQLAKDSSARKPKPYFSIAAEMEKGAAIRSTPSTIREIVRRATLDSVRAHQIADVEVALFLSAGIDSGALLGLMADSGATRIQTITLGFDEFVGTHEDEAPLAKIVASHYGAQHSVRRVGKAEFFTDLPAIFKSMDQPSIDGVNTWFVAKAASEAGIKVALSGLGGDELFGGYPSFSEVPRLHRAIRPFGAVPGLGALTRSLTHLFGISQRRPKIAGLIDYGDSLEGSYLLRRGLFLPFELSDLLPSDMVAEGLERLNFFSLLQAALHPDPGSDIARVASLELNNYTRNQLLRDSDWASMAHSVEIRTPFLDIQLLRELAGSISDFKSSIGKQALAASPSHALPKDIVNRAKSGFALPTGKWMTEASQSLPHKWSARHQSSKGLASRAWAKMVYDSQ